MYTLSLRTKRSNLNFKNNNRLLRHFVPRNEVVITRITIVGAANFMDNNNIFSLDQKNRDAIISMLKKHNIEPKANDLGKRLSRTVTIDTISGQVSIASPGKGKWKL